MGQVVVVLHAHEVLGIFSGASTNTPSLGAGTQTLSTLPGIAPDRLTLPALAYAVTYPTSIASASVVKRSRVTATPKPP